MPTSEGGYQIFCHLYDMLFMPANDKTSFTSTAVALDNIHCIYKEDPSICY